MAIHQITTTIEGAALEFTKSLEILIYPEQVLYLALYDDLKLSINFNKKPPFKINGKIIKGTFDFPLTTKNRKEIERLAEMASMSFSFFTAGDLDFESEAGEKYTINRTEEDSTFEIVIRTDELLHFLDSIDLLGFRKKIEADRTAYKNEVHDNFFDLLRGFYLSGKLTHSESLSLAAAAGRLEYSRNIDTILLTQMETAVKSKQTKAANKKRSIQSEKQKEIIEREWRILKKENPKLTKDAASHLIQEMQGVDIGHGRIYRYLSKI
jgi:hypothetical protein